MKPSKYISFSIGSGKSVTVPFYIGDSKVPSIREEEQKFLGEVIRFSGKSEDTYNLIKDTLKEALDRIEASLIRSEYKLWIHKNYLNTIQAIPAQCAHTATYKTVQTKHTCGQIHKKWVGIPKSATNAIIHSKTGMDIQTISEVYTVAHYSAHTRIRLQGDPLINHVLDHTLEHEVHYCKTKFVTTQALKPKKHTKQYNDKIKHAVVKNVKQMEQERWASHAKNLNLQGHFLTLATQEKGRHFMEILHVPTEM